MKTKKIFLATAMAFLGLSMVGCGGTSSSTKYESSLLDISSSKESSKESSEESSKESSKESSQESSEETSKSSSAEHVHNYGEWIDEIHADCEHAGTKGHYHCDECGKDFDASKEELSSLVIEAVGHTYGEWIAEVAPGCDTKGTKGHYHCSACEKDFDSEKEELSSLEITETGHNYGDWIPVVPATCETDGILGHYHCDGCGKNFDADKKVLESIGITALGHKYGDWIDPVPSTCVSDGTLGHYHCSECEKDFDADKRLLEELKIPAGHTVGEWIPAAAATCTEAGVVGHYHCSACDKDLDAEGAILESVVIPAGHKLGDWIDEVAASCTEVGTKGHYHCSACEKNFDDQHAEITSLEIPMLGHDGVHYPALAATLTEAGHAEFWICSDCSTIFTEEPQDGVWADGSAAAGTALLEAGSSLLIQPTYLTNLEIAVVDSYYVQTYYETQGTYEFEFKPTKTDLRKVDEVVAAAAATYAADVFTHIGDAELQAQDFETYKAAVIEAAAKQISVVVTKSLVDAYKVLYEGPIGLTIQNEHLNAGVGSYFTWIASDPTLTNWNNSEDNRSWTPACFKPSTVMAYANTISTFPYASLGEVKEALDLIMCDVARCSYTAVIECMSYYASNTYGGLTVGGQAANEWWYIWTYAGDGVSEKFIYNGNITTFDKTTVGEFRVCAMGSLGKGTDLATLMTNGNWIIAHQVDDHFIPVA